MTVYVVQCPRRRNRETGKMEPRYDLGPAAIYGELVELLSPTAKPFNPAPLIEELYVKLETFGDDDHLICIGNPILLSLAFGVASDINHGRVRLLQWHNTRGEYVPVEIDMGFTSNS